LDAPFCFPRHLKNDKDLLRAVSGVDCLDASVLLTAATGSGAFSQSRFLALTRTAKGSVFKVIETVCDEELWIWLLFVGSGTPNILTVMQVSSLFFSAANGELPPCTSSVTSNVTTRTLSYYQVNGLYPQFCFFISPVPNPTTEVELTRNRFQEARRKSVEQVYAVLTARYRTDMHPTKYAPVAWMVIVTNAVAILHIIAAEQCRDW